MLWCTSKMTCFTCHFRTKIGYDLQFVVFDCIGSFIYENRLFKETCWYWERGSIGGKRMRQDHCNFSVTSDNFFVSSYSIFNWWYLYIHLQCLCYANVFIISFDLVIFSAVFMFVMISLMNCANISSLICRLMMVLICR